MEGLSVLLSISCLLLPLLLPVAAEETGKESGLRVPHIGPWSALLWSLFSKTSNPLPHTTTTASATSTTTATTLTASTTHQSTKTTSSSPEDGSTRASHSKKRKPTFTFRKKHKRKCEHLSEEELFSMLEDVGAYNQKFMAHSPEEAGRRFHQLLQPPLASVQDAYGGTGKEFRPVKLKDCGAACQSLQLKLRRAVEARDNETESASDLESEISVLQRQQNTEFGAADAGPLEIQEGVNNSTTTPAHQDCALDKFIPVGNCTGRGEEELWGYEKLCSACQGVYLLPSYCFPQFFNAIRCHNKDKSCIYDWWSRSPHGKCEERSLSMVVLRNRGDEDCPRWSFEHINVPISCECYLAKGSWIKA